MRVAFPLRLESPPAVLGPGALIDSHLVPALIADAGRAGRLALHRFFTANIRNPHTRRAYARACNQFFAWCEDRGLTLTTIRPFDVAAYIETLHQTHSPPAALRGHAFTNALAGQVWHWNLNVQKLLWRWRPSWLPQLSGANHPDAIRRRIRVQAL